MQKWLCAALAALMAIGCMAPLLSSQEDRPEFALVLVDSQETLSFDGGSLINVGEPWVTSVDVASVHEDGESLVVELRPDARARLRRLTGAHLGERLAVVVDGRVVAAPIIVAAIESGIVIAS